MVPNNEMQKTEVDVLVTPILARWNLPPDAETVILSVANSLAAPSDGVEEERTSSLGLQHFASRLKTVYFALKILYPENPEMVEGWMVMRNKAFEGCRPVDLVQKAGCRGLEVLAKHLEARLGS